jgi:hypothetical protein
LACDLRYNSHDQATQTIAIESEKTEIFPEMNFASQVEDDVKNARQDSFQSSSPILLMVIAGFVLSTTLCAFWAPSYAMAGERNASSLTLQKASSEQAKTTAPSPANEPFIGTWEGKYKGTKYETLTIEEQGGGLSGTMTTFDLLFDSNGRMNPEPDNGLEVLSDVSVKDGVMRFQIVENNSGPPLNYEFRVKSEKKGELTLVLSQNARKQFEAMPNVPKNFVPRFELARKRVRK